MRPKKIIQLRDHYNFYSSAIFVIRNTVAKIRKMCNLGKVLENFQKMPVD